MTILGMVIIMRIFYLYQINDLCKDLYDNYPCRLYRILKDTYYTSKYNQSLAISSYEEVTLKFNKEFVKKYVFQQYRLEMYYHYKNNVHVLSSNDEYSKLMVSSYSLKLKSNLNCPSFFKCLNSFSDNIFVCDFENGDYFWLHKIMIPEKKLVKE